jgi:hypothetical protein
VSEAVGDVGLWHASRGRPLKYSETGAEPGAIAGLRRLHRGQCFVTGCAVGASGNEHRHDGHGRDG